MILIIAYVVLAMVPVGLGLWESWRRREEDKRLRDRRYRNVLGKTHRRR